MSNKPSRINVQVTEADIARAQQNDSYKCVVAQAIARTLPDAHHIDVDVQTIRFTRDDTRYAFLTPYAVQGYVVGFDAGDEIHPFSFQLRDPKKLRRKVRTEAGHMVDKAASRERRAAAKSHPRKKPAVVTAESVTTADEVKAAYADAVKQRTTDGDRVPPRVFKKKRRAYGHRVLRINRDAAEVVEDS